MDTRLFEEVKKAAYFKNVDDVKIFEEGVWKLVETKDEETFQKLIELFDDETNHPEVMFSLVHALESYPDEKYVSNLVCNLRVGLLKAPESYAGLLIAALNNKNCLLLIKRALLGINKELLNHLAYQIRKISPSHADLIQKLMVGG
jgi:hypothetical protein